MLPHQPQTMPMPAKPILTCLISLIMFGCAINQSTISPNKDFKEYKYAYIKILPKDNFNLGSRIIQELTDMGLQVKMLDIPEGQSYDSLKLTNKAMIVQYSYITSWDFNIYLRSFQIFFYDAQDYTLIANISYQLIGNLGNTEMRYRAAFNEFRKQLGLPLKYVEETAQ